MVVDVDDPRRPRLVRRLTPVDRAHDVVFGDTGERVWVTSGTEHAIAVHDARSGRVLRRLPGGDPPQHVATVPGAVLVTSGDDGSLEVRDPVRGRLRRSVRVPVGSFNVDAGARFVVSPSLSGGTLSILDPTGTERHGYASAAPRTTPAWWSLADACRFERDRCPPLADPPLAVTAGRIPSRSVSAFRSGCTAVRSGLARRGGFSGRGDVAAEAASSKTLAALRSRARRRKTWEPAPRGR